MKISTEDTKIKNILNILDQANNTNLSSEYTNNIVYNISKYSYKISIFAFCIASIFAIVVLFFDNFYLKIFGLSLALLSVISMHVYMVINIYYDFRFIKKSIHQPHQNLEQLLSHEIKIVRKLTTFDSIYLNYILSFLESELTRIKSRVGILIGILDHIGILPASISAVQILNSLSNHGQSSLLDFVAYVLIGLYVAYLFVFRIIEKLNYSIYLIKKAIKIKESGENKVRLLFTTTSTIYYYKTKQLQ